MSVGCLVKSLQKHAHARKKVRVCAWVLREHSRARVRGKVQVRASASAHQHVPCERIWYLWPDFPSAASEPRPESLQTHTLSWGPATCTYWRERPWGVPIQFSYLGRCPGQNLSCKALPSTPTGPPSRPCTQHLTISPGAVSERK